MRTVLLASTLLMAAGSAMARQAARSGRSLGLLGMEERMALAGGRLHVESAPGKGTVIRAHVPLSAEHPAADPT